MVVVASQHRRRARLRVLPFFISQAIWPRSSLRLHGFDSGLVNPIYLCITFFLEMRSHQSVYFDLGEAFF
jgi:hypothetical protein